MMLLWWRWNGNNSTLRYECEFAAWAEGEWCNHTCQENVFSHEYRTKFYITRCENADFRTRSVRKTAFTHSEWYKNIEFCPFSARLHMENSFGSSQAVVNNSKIFSTWQWYFSVRFHLKIFPLFPFNNRTFFLRFPSALELFHSFPVDHVELLPSFPLGNGTFPFVSIWSWKFYLHFHLAMELFSSFPLGNGTFLFVYTWKWNFSFHTHLAVELLRS